MKTIALSGHKVPAQKKEGKLQWLRSNVITELIPFKIWFIVTLLLPAMISTTLLFKAAASLESLVELYFSSMTASTLLSLPVLVVCCILYWCFLKLSLPRLGSRILFLCLLTAGLLAEIVFLQEKEIAGFIFSDVCFYVATFSILVPGLAQVFKPNE